MKYDTKAGLDNNTFVYYEQYDENDIRMPSVVPIDYYTFHRINNNNNQLFTDEILGNFRDENTSISHRGSAISLVNSNIGETNVQIKLKGSIQVSGELEFLLVNKKILLNLISFINVEKNFSLKENKYTFKFNL